jgi:NAD:arginine ADP-ribosyltransferase
MYVDPQKARQEEQERQAKLQAERKRQAKLRQQEEDRNAKLREEENQRAKQRAKAKESESSEGKNSEVKPKNKKPIEQKPEGKKAQNPQTSETKKPDKGTNQTEIAPLNVSTAPVSGQPSLTTPESKPQKPLDRKARTWTGEGDAEPEPQPAAHPIQRSEKEIAYREEVARKQAVKQEERRQKRLQEETKPTETQPEANESSSAPLFPAKPDIKIAASSLSPGVLGTLSEPHLLKSETPLKVNSPTPAEQLALQPSGLVSPVITFQETLKTNALNRLQQNRTRLDQSQQRFSDPDPKNQNWNALRQQSTVVATLNAREQIAKKKLLEAYRNATGDRVSSPFPLFNGFTSPAERRQLALGFYQKQLGPQWKPLAPQIESLINEIYVADSLRAGLYAQEPALAVLTPWELQRANTPEENRELQRKIHGEFGLARGGIQQLEKLLQTDKNSAVALKFDQVVGQTLAGIKDPKQRQQVLDWVEQQQQAEQDRQTQDTMGLAAATFMAVGASTLGVGSLALIFGGIGAFQGGKMSIDALSQAGVNQDALKAGGAGGQRLTAMNPHQAQMDYQMALVNVGLSLLDAKVAVSSIREVLASRQAVQALGKLNPQQVEQFVEATKLQQAGKTAEAQKKLQQLEGEVGEETFKEVTRTGGRLGLSNESGSIRLGGAAEETPALKGKVKPEVGNTNDVKRLRSLENPGLNRGYGSTPEIRKQFREFIGEERYTNYAKEVEMIKLKYPQFKNISTEDLVAVRAYTDNTEDYRLINRALRNGDNNEISRFNAYIQAAESGLNQLPSYNGNVFRGTNLTPENAAKYKPGQIVTEESFFSTSENINKAFDGNTQYIVKSLTGKKVESISVFSGEAEVLFPPGTNFKVTSVEVDPQTGNREIILREVPND